MYSTSNFQVVILKFMGLDKVNELVFFRWIKDKSIFIIGNLNFILENVSMEMQTDNIF
jgi:hypothetical protein